MKPARIVLPALLALALSACGAQSDGPPTGTVPPPVTATDAGASAAPGTAPDTVASPKSERPASAPTTATAIVADPPERYRSPGGSELYFFTPSRNIGCGLDARLVGCQVYKTTALPPGADCDHGTLPRDQLSKGYMSEEGGPFVPSCFNQGFFSMINDQKTLPYGHSVTAGGMTCVSESRGVTCRRGASGFFVSVQSFEQW